MVAAGSAGSLQVVEWGRDRPLDVAEPCTQPDLRPQTEPPDQDRRRAVFLHTGWRSGGTWLWSRCREQPDVLALYEPLHDQLGRLTLSEIRRLRPGSWASNHSETPPYFQEYGPLLLPGKRGVPGYHQRFAYERFFLDAGDEDPELEAYLHGLLDAARPGQVSVLKFCRSLGRTAWLQRRFPDALHVVIMREPVAQWMSARTLLTAQRNRFFVVAPLLVLARNAEHPVVRAAAGMLDVRLPQLHSPDMAYGIEACWRHLRRASAQDGYRSFLAFWALCGLYALRSDAQLVDPQRTATDAGHRDAAERALSVPLGRQIDLRSRPSAGPDRPPWVDAVHRAAAEFLTSQAGLLRPDRLDLLLGYLPAGRCTARPTRAAAAPNLAAASRTRRQRAVTSAAVLIARALQPIRRLNGRLPGRTVR